MDKRADFFITAVRYDENNSHITEVERYKYDKKNDELIEKKTRTRNGIIKAIEKGYTYKTAFEQEDGTWQEGEEVLIITVGGKKYLRTAKTKDNLEDLPEF